MKLLQLLLWGILIYYGYKVVKHAFQPKSGRPSVQGKPKKKSLDIDESQIEDADFEDIDT